jgi:hypothetical protein
MYTFAAMLLFGMLGLVGDLGYAHYVRKSAQNAADAAALGAVIAASQLSSSGFACGSGGIVCDTDQTACDNPPNSPPHNNIDSGCLYAKQNGFVAGGSQNVTMQSAIGSTLPTASGVKQAQYWVTARVNQRLPQLFSAVLGNTSLNVAARASAAIVPAYSGGCIYVLDPTDQNAFVASGSADVHAPCGIYVNSNDSKAMQVTGGACVNAAPAGIYVVGNDNGSDSCITPAPTTGASSFTDPLAGLKEPTFPSSCDHTNVSVTGTQTLSSGTYCGGITVSGGGNATFNSGLYILIGGGLVASSSTAQINGTGVTFYNTACGSSPLHSCPTSSGGSYNGAYKPYVLSGGVTGTLSAPTSGLYNNILLMQDRTLPLQSSQETISGGSTATFTGVVYVPRSPLVYTGGSSSTSPSLTLISWTRTFSGPIYLKNGLNGTGGGTGAWVTLVE